MSYHTRTPLLTSSQFLPSIWYDSNPLPSKGNPYTVFFASSLPFLPNAPEAASYLDEEYKQAAENDVRNKITNHPDWIRNGTSWILFRLERFGPLEGSINRQTPTVFRLERWSAAVVSAQDVRAAPDGLIMSPTQWNSLGRRQIAATTREFVPFGAINTPRNNRDDVIVEVNRPSSRRRDRAGRRSSRAPRTSWQDRRETSREARERTRSQRVEYYTYLLNPETYERCELEYRPTIRYHQSNEIDITCLGFDNPTDVPFGEIDFTTGLVNCKHSQPDFMGQLADAIALSERDGNLRYDNYSQYGYARSTSIRDTPAGYLAFGFPGLPEQVEVHRRRHQEALDAQASERLRGLTEWDSASSSRSTAYQSGSNQSPFSTRSNVTHTSWRDE